MKKILFLLLLGLISSCSTKYDNESLIKDILNNKSAKIAKEFYKSKRYKLRVEDFKKVVQLYSEKINKQDLVPIAYIDQFSYKKKKREGYLFVDKNNNIVYSITYKFLDVKGEQKINYIDFRSSNGDLYCIKYPTSSKVKCVKDHQELPISTDSLSSEYPKTRFGYKFYHSEIASESFLQKNQDSLKNTIQFNLGNANINNNLEKILAGLATELDLSQYTLTECHRHGTPMTNLVHDKGFPREVISAMKKIVTPLVPNFLNIVAIPKNKFTNQKKRNLMLGGITGK